MLRVLAITLVLINVLLLALQAMRPPDRQQPAGVSAALEEAADDAPTIYLLDELPGAPGVQDGTAECFSVGPFTAAEQRDAALDLLAGSALAVTYRQTEAIVDSGTWVYLPPLADRETAENMALTMQDAGLGEAVVIEVGEWRNAVSLGFFTNRAYALERYDEARSLGFKVQARTQQGVEPRYWLDYEQKLGAPYLIPLEATAIPPELHRAIPCAPDSAGMGQPGSGN